MCIGYILMGGAGLACILAFSSSMIAREGSSFDKYFLLDKLD